MGPLLNRKASVSNADGNMSRNNPMLWIPELVVSHVEVPKLDHLEHGQCSGQSIVGNIKIVHVVHPNSAWQSSREVVVIHNEVSWRLWRKRYQNIAMKDAQS